VLKLELFNIVSRYALGLNIGYKLSKHSDVVVSVSFFCVIYICTHASVCLSCKKYFYIKNEAFIMRINSNKHEMTSLLPQRNCVITHTHLEKVSKYKVNYVCMSLIL